MKKVSLTVMFTLLALGLILTACTRTVDDSRLYRLECENTTTKTFNSDYVKHIYLTDGVFEFFNTSGSMLTDGSYTPKLGDFCKIVEKEIIYE